MTTVPRSHGGARTLAALGLLCWLVALVFLLVGWADGMTLARLGWLAAAFAAFALGGMLLDTGDDRAREAKETAQGGPNRG